MSAWNKNIIFQRKTTQQLKSIEIFSPILYFWKIYKMIWIQFWCFLMVVVQVTYFDNESLDFFVFISRASMIHLSDWSLNVFLHKFLILHTRTKPEEHDRQKCYIKPQYIYIRFSWEFLKMSKGDFSIKHIRYSI